MFEENNRIKCDVEEETDLDSNNNNVAEQRGPQHHSSLENVNRGQKFYQQRGSLPPMYLNQQLDRSNSNYQQQQHSNLNHVNNNIHQETVEPEVVAPAPNCVSASCDCFGSLYCRMCDLFGRPPPDNSSYVSHHQMAFAVSANMTRKQVIVTTRTSVDQQSCLSCNNDNCKVPER